MVLMSPFWWRKTRSATERMTTTKTTIQKSAWTRTKLRDDIGMEETDNRPNRLTAGITDSPRGATLSTSTSSFEALDPHDSNLSRLATKAFDRTSTYVTHELNASIDDYKLLENMNRATIAKYSDMQQISENLATSSVQLKEKFDNLVSAEHLLSFSCTLYSLRSFPSHPFAVTISGANRWDRTDCR